MLFPSVYYQVGRRCLVDPLRRIAPALLLLRKVDSYRLPFFI